MFATSMWSLGTVLSRRIDVPQGAMGFAAEMITGGVTTLLVSLLFRESWTLPTSPAVWWAWAYLVVFGSLIAFSAYRILVERASPTLAFRRVTVPLVLPGLASGSVLAFARCLGEFGATTAFAGSLQGTTRTLPLLVYLERETDADAAVALSLVLVVVAVVVIAVARPRGAEGLR